MNYSSGFRALALAASLLGSAAVSADSAKMNINGTAFFVETPDALAKKALEQRAAAESAAARKPPASPRERIAERARRLGESPWTWIGAAGLGVFAGGFWRRPRLPCCPKCQNADPESLFDSTLENLAAVGVLHHYHCEACGHEWIRRKWR